MNLRKTLAIVGILTFVVITSVIAYKSYLGQFPTAIAAGGICLVLGYWAGLATATIGQAVSLSRFSSAFTSPNRKDLP